MFPFTVYGREVEKLWVKHNSEKIGWGKVRLEVTSEKTGVFHASSLSGFSDWRRYRNVATVKISTTKKVFKKFIGWRLNEMAMELHCKREEAALAVEIKKCRDELQAKYKIKGV